MEHLGLRIAAAPLPGDPDRADRLVVGAAARPGDAGHRHRDRRPGMHQRARHHFDHGFAADRAIVLQRFRAHAQQRLLGLVAVGGQAAVEPVGRAGDIGHGLGDPAAGAAFGGDQHLSRIAQARAEAFGQQLQFVVAGRVHAADGLGDSGKLGGLSSRCAPNRKALVDVRRTAHAADAPVLRRQGRASGRAAVLPHGRLLRAVLRRRAQGGASCSTSP